MNNYWERRTLNNCHFSLYDYSDNCVMGFTPFVHLCFFNFNGVSDSYAIAHRSSMGLNIKNFAPYYHRFKKLRNCNIGFHINKVALNICIEEIEKYFERKKYRKTYKTKRVEANIFNSKMRKILITEYSFCVSCESINDLSIDHVIPISKGGNNIKSNVQILCKSCNSKKSNKIA